MFWTGFVHPEQTWHGHTPFRCPHPWFPPNKICSFMWQQLLLFMSIRVWCKCYGTSEPWLSLWSVWDFRGRGRWEGQVRRGRKVVPHVVLLVSCFLFIVWAEVLSYGDNKALTFDSCGTEAHPATDAILFSASSHLITWPVWPAMYSHLNSMYVIVDHSAPLWLNGCLTIIINISINQDSSVIIVTQNCLECWKDNN